MAVAMTMVKMKVAVLRHSMSGQRAGFAVMGAVAGLVLAGGTIWLGLGPGELLAAAYAVWMLGWIFGPAFAGGGDETLRPEFFTLLGLPPRRLATGLLVSAFVGVAPVISLLALAGLTVHGARLGVLAALVSVPAALAQLAVLVLLSRVAVALLGLALRSRTGAVGAGLANGLVLALLGQIWVVFVALGRPGGVPPVVGEVARNLPSGWGVVAVEAAGSDDWAAAGAALAALVVLAALLLAAWGALLTRRAGTARTAPGGRAPMRATTASGAVLSKELRTWSRDLVRTHQLTFALAYGVFFAAAPLLIGVPDMLPLAGPIFVLMAAALSSNLYGTDGTVLWLALMTPGAADVRGRQHAWLLTVAPVAVALTVALTAAVDGSWPVMLAMLAALLGGGAGLVPLVSVYALIPGIDPHKRGGNPLRFTEEDGAVTGMVYAVLALTAVTAVPATVVAALTGWPGVAVGIVTGALCYRWFGLLAERALLARGPELLETMRTGRRPAATAASGTPRRWTRFENLPRRDRVIVGVCSTAGAIPLFPQGVLPAVFKVNGEDTKAWFLALYLPEPWQWPVIIFMIVLGIAVYATAVVIPLRHRPDPAEDRGGEQTSVV